MFERWTWESTAPGVAISPSPGISPVCGPISRSGLSATSREPALPAPTITPSLMPMLVLRTPSIGSMTTTLLMSRSSVLSVPLPGASASSRNVFPKPPTTSSAPKGRSTTTSAVPDGNRPRSRCGDNGRDVFHHLLPGENLLPMLACLLHGTSVPRLLKHLVADECDRFGDVQAAPAGQAPTRQLGGTEDQQSLLFARRQSHPPALLSVGLQARSGCILRGRHDLTLNRLPGTRSRSSSSDLPRLPSMRPTNAGGDGVPPEVTFADSEPPH